MKKLITIVLLLVAITCQAKYCLGYVTTTVNMRECASTECGIICKVKLQSFVLYNTDDMENGFYRAIYLDKDEEGYIHSKYVKFYQEVQEHKGGALQRIGESSNMWPTISLENDCNRYTTLRLNTKTYKLEPYEKREIMSEPGIANIIVTSKGTFPYVGAEVLENNIEYGWVFRIVDSNQQHDNETTVYIPFDGGGKFHKYKDCKNLLPPYKKITVKEAVDKGYTECHECFNTEK